MTSGEYQYKQHSTVLEDFTGWVPASLSISSVVFFSSLNTVALFKYTALLHPPCLVALFLLLRMSCLSAASTPPEAQTRSFSNETSHPATHGTCMSGQPRSNPVCSSPAVLNWPVVKRSDRKPLNEVQVTSADIGGTEGSQPTRSKILPLSKHAPYLPPSPTTPNPVMRNLDSFCNRRLHTVALNCPLKF